MLKWTGRTALELLGQGALGYSFDPLTADVPNRFAESVKSFLCVPPCPASLPRYSADPPPHPARR